MEEKSNRPPGGGWVRLFRDELDGAVFSHCELWRLWTWCLLRAGHKRRTLTVRTGRGESIITLDPGQFLYGRNSAGKALGTPPRTVADRMAKLARLGKIVMQPASHCSVVTIVGWQTYGGADEATRHPTRQPSATQPPTIRQATATNKNAGEGGECQEVDHSGFSLKEEGLSSETEAPPAAAGGAIADPSWQRTYHRARRLARTAKLPRSTDTQREAWLKIARLVEIQELPEAVAADSVAGLLARGDDVRDRWAYLFVTIRTNARDNHKIDLEAGMARVAVPPSVLHHKPAGPER